MFSFLWATLGKHKLTPETWVKEYADALLSYAIARVNDRETARDLVQESFLVAFRTRDTFRGELSEKNWLYLILRSRILDYYKKKKEVSFSKMSSDDDDQDLHFNERGHWNKEYAPKAWDADQLAHSNEFNKALKECKEKLPEKQGAAFTLKYLEEKDSEEICKELNITPSNYWVLIHRAKIALQDCLKGKGIV